LETFKKKASTSLKISSKSRIFLNQSLQSLENEFKTLHLSGNLKKPRIP
jgi:hypothetical protein